MLWSLCITALFVKLWAGWGQAVYRRWAGCGKSGKDLPKHAFPFWLIRAFSMGCPRAVHGLPPCCPWLNRQLCINPQHAFREAAVCMQPTTSVRKLFPPGCVELPGGRRGCENKRNILETFWGNGCYLAFGILRCCILFHFKKKEGVLDE